MTKALASVVEYGTGTAAQQDLPVYGKTGTTNNNTDAWFVGCTRSLCIATWMGYDRPHPLVGVEGVGEVFGGTLPAKIFAKSWDNYREIQAIRANGGVSPTPSPTHVTFTHTVPQPQPQPTKTAKHSPKPQPTHTPKPQPTEPPPTPQPTKSKPTLPVPTP